MFTRRFSHLLSLLAFTWFFSAVSASLVCGKDTTDYYDIGDFHYSVTTDSEEAQTWFNRGLAMCHGFNHEEAVRCFERAVAADPGMPMAYWGMAYAWGPNINNMEIEADQMAQAELAIRLARLHSQGANDLERELIAALAERYAMPVPEERRPLNEAYANAMREVYQRHSDDALVASLFAESLMNLSPWKYWSPEGEPAPETPEIVEVLERGLEQAPDHPMLCHLYIHAVEASPNPEKALPAADRLGDVMPGVGHLVHMPSHIYVQVGDYASTIDSNLRAIEADREFLKREGPYNFYTLYRIHNYHFVVYGAMFDGQSELALTKARELVEQVPEEMLREQIDFLDAFIPTALHVLVRFGRWEDILEEPEPADYLPVTRSIWHYTRGLAYAALGQVDQAEAEQQSFEEVRDTVPETSYLFQNPSLSILEIAEEMLAGEIAYRQGKFEKAFKHLRRAVELDDGLNYDEPWGWMQPARHALGALLMEQGQYEQSEAVYREDLRRHPNNPWALHGLAESLAKQGMTSDAAECRARFKTSAQRSDVTIDRSCFCRLDVDAE